jgi:hypothetical protein
MATKVFTLKNIIYSYYISKHSLTPVNMTDNINAVALESLYLKMKYLVEKANSHIILHPYNTNGNPKKGIPLSTLR